METHVKGKTCTTFSPRSWSVNEVGTLCSSKRSCQLDWLMLLVTISILVNHALISKFSPLAHNSSSLVSLSSSPIFLNLLEYCQTS